MSDPNNFAGGEQNPNGVQAGLAPEQAPQNKKNGRKAGIIIASCVGVAILGAAAVAAFAFYSKGSAYPTNHISSEASAYVQLNTDPSGEQKLSLFNLLDKYPELKEDLELNEVLKGNTLQNMLQKMNPEGSYSWAGDKASIAVGDISDTAQENPPIVLFIESNDDEAAERELSQMTAEANASDPNSFTSYTIYGDGYVSLQTEASSAALLNVDNGSLSDDDDFKKLMKDKDGNILSGWGDLGKLNNAQAGMNYLDPYSDLIDQSIAPGPGPGSLRVPDAPIVVDEAPDMTIMPVDENEIEDVSTTSDTVVVDDPMYTTQNDMLREIKTPDIKGEFAFTVEVRDTGLDFAMDQTELYLDGTLVPNAGGEDEAAKLANEITYSDGIGAIGISSLGESMALSWKMIDPEGNLLRDTGIMIETPDDLIKLFGDTAAISLATDVNDNFKLTAVLSNVDEEYFTSILTSNGVSPEQIETMLRDYNPESKFVVEDGRVYLQMGPTPEGGTAIEPGQSTGYVNLDNIPGIEDEEYGRITFKVNEDGDWTKSTLSWTTSR